MAPITSKLSWDAQPTRVARGYPYGERPAGEKLMKRVSLYYGVTLARLANCIR